VLPIGLCELAWTAHEVGAARRFLEVIGGAFETRWIDAARAIASGEAGRAAALCDEMGARPEAAYTRMRSGDPGEVDQALAFWRSVDAARYIHECEQLLAATA